MRIIATVNQKGGSGKTTTAVNLAAALGEQGRRVLILDVDPQASASAWFGIPDGGRGLLDAFVDNGNLLDLIQKVDIKGVGLIPSSAWLVGVEKALAGEVGAETILHRKLQKIPEKDWDYLFIDCPPTLGVLTINALTAAREVLVPVEAHVMALQGLAQLTRTVEVVRERLNETLSITGILACRVNRTRHAQDVVEQLRNHFGSKVFQTVIRENVRLAECPSFGIPINLYDPKSIGAEDYHSLATELITQELP
jgi:chromosome partitioning protein